MANLIFTLPTHDVSGLGTLTCSVVDAAYPLANLVDANPAKPLKFTATSGAVVWDRGAPEEVQLVAIPHHNLQAGLEVRFQMHASNDWTGPTVNLAFTIPAFDKDGFPPRLWLDVKSLVPVQATRTQRWRRLVVVGANGANVQLGEVKIYSAYQTLSPRNIKWPLRRAWRKKNIAHETDYEVETLYRTGSKVELLTADLTTTDAGEQQVLEWWDACDGRGVPFILVPDPARNDALLVRWANDVREESHEFLDLHQIPLAWREVSRGLVL